ncbi:MAG: saccharopine dehydrogenase C-terminal domain-containing protein [Thermoplasmatota archaeon]
MKEVLVIGAGLVSGPLVRYLLADAGFRVTVASRTVEKAKEIIQGHEMGEAVSFDITRDENLDDLISGHDIAVSLLPYAYHTKVAASAVENGKHMVTTSYVSDEMRLLDRGARDAGVILLNEMGLDPGIDHMEAQRIIDGVHSEGGKVTGFISFCGGLPAPEANNNPWGYKFSWSPKGVVLASRNPARFREDGKEKVIPGSKLFAEYRMIDIEGLDSFEGYPNRDSVPYADIYGIPDAETVLRGTLRNKGWCDTWKGLHDIGMLQDQKPKGSTYYDMMEELVFGDGELKERLKKRIDTRNDPMVIRNWEWLGLLEEKELLDHGSRIDALSKLLEKKLNYAPGERDMIVLKHTFEIDMPEGRRTLHSTMVDFGIPNGDSAMSRTVGLPAAMGVEMILNGELDHLSGVHIPILPEIYGPSLERLGSKGIEFN